MIQTFCNVGKSQPPAHAVRVLPPLGLFGAQVCSGSACSGVGERLGGFPIGLLSIGANPAFDAVGIVTARVGPATTGIARVDVMPGDDDLIADARGRCCRRAAWSWHNRRDRASAMEDHR